MKSFLAFLLAMCLLFSSSAMASSGPISTEELLVEVIGLMMTEPFWLEVDAPELALSAGVTADETGGMAMGGFCRQGQQLYAGAADALGVLFSNGQETQELTWEALNGLLGGAQSSGLDLTQADQALLAGLVQQVLQPVGQLVTVTKTETTLDGAAAQMTEIVIPLQKMACQLDDGVSKALEQHHTELDGILQKNRRFLIELGINCPPVAVLRSNWQQLGVSSLLPEGAQATLRMTTAGSKWLLRADALGAGAEIRFDGAHADGRIFWNGGEWTFDTRDLVQALGWVTEVLRYIGPDALEVTCSKTADGLRAHVHFDLQKLVTDLQNGLTAVFTRHEAEIGALFAHYLPGVDPEYELNNLKSELQLMVMQTMRRTKDHSTPKLEADVYYTRGGLMELSCRANGFSAEASVDAYGMKASVQWYERLSHMRGVEISGRWGADAMLLTVRSMYDGEIEKTWELNGIAQENEAVDVHFSIDGAWQATCRIRPDGLDLDTLSGVEGSLNVSETSLTVRGANGSQTLDAGLYAMDDSVSARVSCAAFDGSFSLRTENDGAELKAEWENKRGSMFSSVTTLETAVYEDRFSFRWKSGMRRALSETGVREISLDLSPDRASGNLTLPPTYASFAWAPGALCAQSTYYMSGLNVTTAVLAADMTQPTDDGNVTEISIIQHLAYPNETVRNQYQYTARSTVPQPGTLQVDITGADDDIRAVLQLLQGPDSARERVLTLLHPQQEPQPAPAPEPEPEEEGAAKPASGMFLTKP